MQSLSCHLDLLQFCVTLCDYNMHSWCSLPAILFGELSSATIVKCPFSIFEYSFCLFKPFQIFGSPSGEEKAPGGSHYCLTLYVLVCLYGSVNWFAANVDSSWNVFSFSPQILWVTGYLLLCEFAPLCSEYLELLRTEGLKGNSQPVGFRKGPWVLQFFKGYS